MNYNEGLFVSLIYSTFSSPMKSINQEDMLGTLERWLRGEESWVLLQTTCV